MINVSKIVRLLDCCASDLAKDARFKQIVSNVYLENNTLILSLSNGKLVCKIGLDTEIMKHVHTSALFRQIDAAIDLLKNGILNR